MAKAKTKANLNLKMISLRLQKPVIDDLKDIANASGLHYQTLIRAVLTAHVAATKAKRAMSQTTPAP